LHLKSLPRLAGCGKIVAGIEKNLAFMQENLVWQQLFLIQVIVKTKSKWELL